MRCFAVSPARNSIHIAMLTFDVSMLGVAVTDLLLEKKRQNPDIAIRLIVDAYGSEGFMPWSAVRRNLKKMRDAGIDVAVNNVFRVGLEHRKVVVVDGERGFFGGASFGKEYYASARWWKRFHEMTHDDPQQVSAYFRRRYDPQTPLPDNLLCLADEKELPQFHDFGFSCQGNMVRDLQSSFLQSWLFHGKSLEPASSEQQVRARYFPEPPAVPASGDTLPHSVQMIHSVPGGISEMACALGEVVGQRGTALDLTFAYILVPAFVDQLVEAAQRGVKSVSWSPVKRGST